MANNELFRTESIRHKGKDIPVHGARLRRDSRPNQIYICIITLAGIGGFLLLIYIIVRLIFF